MLSAQPLPVTSPEINELTILRTYGLVPGTTATALRLPSPPVTYSSSVMQHTVQFESQLLGILSDIDTTPPPFASPATAAQQSVCASPLTERALRYYRRDALRTDRSAVAPVPLPRPTDSPDPLDDFGAETHKQDRLNFTPAPPSESFHSTIQSKIPSLGPEQYRPTSAHSQPRMPFEYSTPTTFPRLIQAPHTADQRPLSAGPRCPPRAPPLPARSRASRSMSSSLTSSPAKAAAKGARPSVLETASPRLDAKPGRPQGAPSPVASSTLRAISGSGSERTHGLRPDAPVSPRALLGGPRGPPAHFGCLDQVWDSMDPTLRTRIDSITLQDVEASVAHARAATDDDQARTTADACALSPADQEYTLAMEPLQKKAASIDSEHADLSARIRHLESLRRSTAAEMATAARQHQRIASNIGVGYRQPPPARAATRSAAPAASVTFSAPTAPQWRHTAASAPLQHQAPAVPTGSTAPPAAPAVGSTMPPPPPPAARVPFTTPAPWSIVAARRPRQPPPTPCDDRYLDLRLSKLMFVNKFYPADTRKPIKELASQVDAAFRSLGMDKCHLRLAVQLATQDGTALCEFLVDDILRLRDLPDRAYATPAGAGWVREALDQAAASRRPARSASSGSDISFSAGARRRDEPSSGRDNSKRATLTETSDSDDRQPRYQGRHHPDERQVTARIYHATDDDSDAPPFPPRIFRYRNRSRRPHPRVATPRVDCTASVTNDFPSLQNIVEAATAAAIAAVDHHLAHLGLTSRPDTASLHDTVHHHRSHANPRPETASLHNTVHHHRSHATPRPETASIHDHVPHHRSHAIPRSDTAPLNDTVHPYHSHATPAPIAPRPSLTGLVAPTPEPPAISTHASCPPVGPAAVGMPPQMAVPSDANPTHNGYPLTPLLPMPALLQPAAPTANPAISIAPAPSAPPDERILCDDSSSQTSSNSSPLGLSADFVANMQAAYRTLDMRRVPRIQPLQFPSTADRTAAVQLLIRSMRDALSGIFDVADPT